MLRSHKGLRPRFLYVIHSNNTVSRMPYFTDYPAFVRLLVKTRSKASVEADYRDAVAYKAQKAVDTERILKLQAAARERDIQLAAERRAQRRNVQEEEPEEAKKADAAAATPATAAKGAKKGEEGDAGKAPAKKDDAKKDAGKKK